VTADSTYGLSALLECSMELRTAGAGATSMESAADQVVRFLRSHFVDKQTGRSALPLVRLYLTQRAAQLEPSVRDFATAAGTDSRVGPDVVCLTLLATAGEEESWNDRRRSVGHKAIPLPSVETLQRLPMVSRLFQQLGVDPRRIVAADREVTPDVERRPYDVFYVADARDHPSVPAQADFVIPYGIRSAVGFGGILPDGETFAVMAFSCVPIPEPAVDAFVAAALATKLALLPFVGGPIFDGWQPSGQRQRSSAELEQQRVESRADTVERLLEVRAGMVHREAARLETELARAEERSTALAESRRALALSEARKAAIVEGALDCVIGMDADGRIVEFNLAAEQTFGHDRADVLGELLSDVLVPVSMRERHRIGLSTYRETGEGPILGRRIEVNALHRDGHEFPVELTVTKIADAEPSLFTGYMRDLTEAKRASAALATSHERLAHIARTLQTSLLPPELPEIEGFEIAAAYHAMGDGFEVGGDFYDVFQLNDDQWALTLGDVCGKGSEAAAITALTRYTIRAAAMRQDDPRDVLETVHEAIRREESTRFCTAVYADLVPGSGRVRLALGGHPNPLVVRAGGGVEPVGSHGHLLGSFPTWSGTTETFHLDPGDVLLLFSDGVTEARRGDELFGDDRLATTLVEARGNEAADVIRHIEQAVLGFAGALGDDVAILAIRRCP
jgi:sigma-B regulation protein RsbU (phosphoserine phosphatase)